MQFPETIFVTLDPNRKEGEGERLLVWTQEGDGIVDDGPTPVARYRYFETRQLKKTVTEAKEA
jgi:hypothetical protein